MNNIISGKNLSIKPMSVDEMILALDRISRFKFPKDKLKRVYVETVCSNIIGGSNKKTQIFNLENKMLCELFTEIWNFSIETNFKSSNKNFSLNKNYIEEEKKCYYTDKADLDLMPIECDFSTLIKKIEKSKIPNNFDKYKTPRKIVLTEGVTEEILMPEFSKIYGFDWNKNGIIIVGTGGKSRILKQYRIFKEQLKIPIFILLDFDAENIFRQLKKEMRKIDSGHLINLGEIEDIIPVNLFKRAINSEFKLQAKISVKDFDKNLSMVKNLKNIFKEKGFGEFKKAKMANWIKAVLTKKSELSEELELILSEVKKF